MSYRLFGLPGYLLLHFGLDRNQGNRAAISASDCRLALSSSALLLALLLSHRFPLDDPRTGSCTLRTASLDLPTAADPAFLNNPGDLFFPLSRRLPLRLSLVSPPVFTGTMVNATYTSGGDLVVDYDPSAGADGVAICAFASSFPSR